LTRPNWNCYRDIRIAGEELEEPEVQEPGLLDGIAGYDEEARAFYTAGSLNEETPDELSDVE
jgi:hypothetical protein